MQNEDAGREREDADRPQFLRPDESRAATDHDVNRVEVAGHHEAARECCLIWTEIGFGQMQHQEGKDQNAVVIKRRRRNERRSENEKNVGNDRDRDRPIRRPTGLLHEERNRGDDGDVAAHTLEKIERVPLENPVLLENELRSTRDERDDHTHAALPEQHLGVDAGSRLAGGVQAEWGVGQVLTLGRAPEVAGHPCRAR